VRAFFLFLSRQKQLRKWMETSAVGHRLAGRFVAVTRKINTEGITVTLDYLGESVSSLQDAAAARDIYLHALDAIHQHGLQANVSLKLTQFGLDLSYEQCRANVEQLVSRARDNGSFVRIDMESSEYTQRTLDLASDLAERYGSVGVVIQAYLRRSRADIERLNAAGTRVRLCKGAYLEAASVAFEDKTDVDRNYLELAKTLLQNGTYPAIATHDEQIIDAVKRFATEKQISRDRFEFQMLYGIRRDLQRKLVKDGWRLRLYVPFGEAWYPYYMRRMAERPANLFFVLRNLLRK